MSRGDIGPQFPSDDNDSAPLDPARNRQQFDYASARRPIRRPPGRLAASGGSSASVDVGTLISVNEDDYSISVGGIIVLAKKPWFLRQSTEVTGLTFSYEDSSLRKVVDEKGASWWEEIQPPYDLTVEEIIVATASDGTVIALDLARRWTKVEEFRALVKSVHEDYLMVVELDGEGGEVGEQFKCAKPRHLQTTPWDGQAVDFGADEIQYTQTDTQTREAELVGGGGIAAGDIEIQVINPPYLVDVDIIRVGQVRGGNGLDDDDIQYIDLNDCGRQWGRRESKT